jgi:hypothetical protein
MTRTCKDCNETYPITNFYTTGRKKKDGSSSYSSFCKTCSKERYRSKEVKERLKSEYTLPEQYYCPKCNTTKSITEFLVRPDTGRPRTPCKKCNTEINKVWRENNPGYTPPHIENALGIGAFRRYRWKSTYNLTLEQTVDLMNLQEGSCAICFTPFTTEEVPHVDHSHMCCPGKKSCGKCIRGFLCGLCNVGIGSLRDDTKIIESALKYLRQ